MRFIYPLVLLFALLAPQSIAAEVPNAVKHAYQSDVSRLRNIVINSLYSHKEIFLRELISNSNDALEKLRISALKDKSLWDGTPLNITIRAYPNEDGKGGEIVITDSGIGMTPEELTANLGTLAKSGTSEFINKVDKDDAGGANGNLIGAFGLGFYSSFLVADRVEVASVSPKSKEVPPQQYVFASSADESSFQVYPDPRGNTLGRGTEIRLHLKPDATEYLDTQTLAQLIHKHSAFSSSFPVYLWEKSTKMVPIEEAEVEEAETAAGSERDGDEVASKELDDEEEALIEEVVEEAKPMDTDKPTMKDVTKEDWSHINSQPPLWQRDQTGITDFEFEAFYTGFFKDFGKPLAWHHFGGDTPDGVAFKGMIFIPEKLPEEFWQKPLDSKVADVKLMVKRTFITSDLGEHSLPKWASWVKVVFDADDLPLNVSRETLQNNRFLKQMRGIILKRIIQLFQKIQKEQPEKWGKLQKEYGPVLKLGAVEDVKNRDKLVSLTRFTTNQRNETSYDQYVANMREGQSQIFYIGEVSKTAEELAQSIFAEKLIARGYEVMLLTEPLDEVLFGTLKEWKGIPFQDIAKAGLKFGDEDPEEEASIEAAHKEQFKPLIDWLKKELEGVAQDVVISRRLVSSPCAIVADTYGYSANVQRMMSSSNQKRNDIMHEFAMKAKLLEINPHSPLIEGLLRRVKELTGDGDEEDEDAEAELREVAGILIDGALVRSGYDVVNKNLFLGRIDRVLRRSLGVSETAKASTVVTPAPPVAPPQSKQKTQETAVPTTAEDDVPRIVLPDHLKDKIQIEMEVIPEDEPIGHDEL